MGSVILYILFTIMIDIGEYGGKSLLRETLSVYDIDLTCRTLWNCRIHLEQ